jgi:hypothetical protein
MKKSQIAILLLGLFCVCAGLFRNEAQEIFQKATLICLECIGLG